MMTEKPLVHLFRLAVAPENREQFKEIGYYNLTTSQKNEEGTLAMFAAHLKDEATVSYVFEIYRDAAAYQLHRSSSQYQTFVKEAGPLLTERLAYEVEPVFLEEKLGRGDWLREDDFLLKLALVEVDPRHQADFKAIVTDEMQQSMDKEAGVLAMYAMVDADKANQYYFFEIYRDAAAYQAHRETPHFQAYIEGTQDFVLNKALFDLVNDTSISKGLVSYRFKL